MYFLFPEKKNRLALLKSLLHSPPSLRYVDELAWFVVFVADFVFFRATCAGFVAAGADSAESAIPTNTAVSNTLRKE